MAFACGPNRTVLLVGVATAGVVPLAERSRTFAWKPDRHAPGNAVASVAAFTALAGATVAFRARSVPGRPAPTGRTVVGGGRR